MRRVPWRARWAVGAAVALCGAALAQGPPAEAPVAAPEREDKGPPAFDQLPPQVKLGVRVEGVRRRLPVAPVVVVVPDGRSYVRAIARWGIDSRFPVLIDDGTPAAREAIGRFVRAFAPEQTLVWKAPDGGAEPRSLRDAVEAAVASAWGAPDYAGLAARWAQLGFSPPGVVVASEMDPAWTAAAALAAGRGEPIVWLDKCANNPGGAMTEEEFASFDAGLARWLDASGAQWRALGDVIDGVALCTNMPAKTLRQGKIYATTDALGRLDAGAGARWGWAGQIIGDEAAAAYRAMCALFLQPTRAWLFNAYEDSPPFNQYDVRPAATVLARAGIEPTIDMLPRARPLDWRMRTAHGIDAGLILVNSAGWRRWFELPPGSGQKGYAHDAPFLDIPAVVQMIHSFSAQDVNDRDSIGARWLENGAYGYVGAVDEPYLQAFNTPEQFVSRLIAPTPLGVAARLDGAPVWKVAVFGDPLLTVTSRTLQAPGPPKAPIPDLEGAQDLDALMATALREKRFADGLWALVEMARVADAARLIRAATNPQAGQEGVLWSPDLARAALLPLFQTGQSELFFRAYLALDPKAADDTRTVDMLWQAVGPDLPTTNSPLLLETLRRHIRDYSAGEDGVALSRAMRRVSGPGAADRLLGELAAATKDDEQRKKLEEELGRAKR